MAKTPLKGISLAQLMEDYPDDAAAEHMFIERRWPDGIACPHCGDMDIQENAPHPDMPYRCRGCKKFFSVKTGTLMEGSKLGFRTWLIAMHRLLVNPKGTSSVQLHKDLGITQKSAWFLAHRIRESWTDKQDVFREVVEVDETFVGGKEKNKHGRKKDRSGSRGWKNKMIVAGARERATGKFHAQQIPNTDQESLGDFVTKHTEDNAIIYTNEHNGYDKIPRHHYHVQHGIGQYEVDGIHTNGIESLWACVKRSHKGIYHQWSRKRLHRYLNECCGRLNMRDMDVIDQMGDVVRGMDGKRLDYKTLISSPVMPTEVKPKEWRFPSQRNMSNPKERLTQEEKKEIVKLYRAGRGGYKKLGRRFNVSFNVIRAVVLDLRKHDRPGRPRKR